MREWVYDLTKQCTGAWSECVDLLRHKAAAHGRSGCAGHGPLPGAAYAGRGPAGEVVTLARVDERGRRRR